MARPGVYDFPASESSTSDKQPAWHPDEQQRAVEQPPELPQLYKEWPATLSRPSARSQPTPSKQQRRRRWSTLFTTNKSASPPDLNPPDYFSLSNLPSPTSHPAPSPSNNLSPGPTADLTGPIVSPNSQDQEQQQTQAGEPRPRRNARHSLGSRLSSVIHVLTKHTNNLSLNRSSDPPKPSSQIQENSIDRHTTHPTNHPHSTHNNTSSLISANWNNDPQLHRLQIDEEPEEEEEGPIRERNRAANRSKALANLEGSHLYPYPTESREKIGIEL
ncbi:hypothetical protein PSHT_03966 [Puccinia striiformis]|uniref:Uncharacterized protein n=1 Tax=Puccinia striiformis TaxID=27350 RepID=A0A2S4WE96_9BASI|nr:hypothetical protein PSHT_03966 [Puccinia striiformis]